MVRIVGALAAALLIPARVVQAQDVVEVSPETHAVILENAQVRVLAVRIKAGEKVGMHSHPANVVYYLSDGKIKLTLANGHVEDRVVKADTAVWSEPTVHAAENVGGSELREVQIELKVPTKQAEP
jgi:beta-alanine degradation protein BauB